MPFSVTYASKLTGESKWTMPPRSPGPARTRSSPAPPSSAAPITRTRSNPCARKSRSAGNQTKALFVVLVIVLIIVRFGTRALGGCRAAARTGFHRHDQRPRLDLRTGVEHDDGFTGRAQQALFFQYLEYASRHLTGAAHQAGKLLPAHFDLHPLGM